MENLVGYRFHPTDEELVNHYLNHKILGNECYVRDAINQVDICKYEPWELCRKSKIPSDNQVWYFFCQLDYKYPKSKRVNRTTKEGFWKATGKDREIKAKNQIGKVIGTKKTLVFHEGRVPNGEKTDWVIHEYYSLILPSDQSKYVVCKLKYKGTSTMSTRFYGGGEPSYLPPSGSQYHEALVDNLELDEQIEAALMADCSEPEEEMVQQFVVQLGGVATQRTPFLNHSFEEMAQQLVVQVGGVATQRTPFLNHSFDSHNRPHAQFDSNQDQEIYDFDVAVSDQEEFVNSLLADPDEPSYEDMLLPDVYHQSSNGDVRMQNGFSMACRSNLPKSINCIARVERADSSVSSETSRESLLQEMYPSDSETSECHYQPKLVPKRNVPHDKTSRAKGGAAVSAVDVDVAEKTTSKKNLQKQFEDIRKRKGFSVFLKTIEIHHEPCPPVVYVRNLVLGIILFGILIHEATVVR